MFIGLFLLLNVQVYCDCEIAFLSTGSLWAFEPFFGGHRKFLNEYPRGQRYPDFFLFYPRMFCKDNVFYRHTNFIFMYYFNSELVVLNY